MRRRARVRIPVPVGKRGLLFALLALPVFLTIALIIIHQLQVSLFFQKKDRLNIVFYGPDTVYYSVGKWDGVNYFISFYPDVKVKVPGGYGSYRVGGLGKLVELEKKADLYRKTFSVTTASTVDRYFYRKSSDIYYGQKELDEETLSLPGFSDIFFTPSNSNLFDRIYVYLQLAGKGRGKFTRIDYKSSLGTDEEFFQDKDFAKKYLGFFFNRIYRKEQRQVQIQYSDSYKTAFFLSKVIEGDGIRVSDLSETDGIKGRCQVIEEGTDFSRSARDLASFFGCNLKNGTTESSDIIMKLGTLEKDWEIL